jgi:hypothetical protein
MYIDLLLILLAGAASRAADFLAARVVNPMVGFFESMAKLSLSRTAALSQNPQQLVPWARYYLPCFLRKVIGVSCR